MIRVAGNEAVDVYPSRSVDESSPTQANAHMGDVLLAGAKKQQVAGLEQQRVVDGKPLPALNLLWGIAPEHDAVCQVGHGHKAWAIDAFGRGATPQIGKAVHLFGCGDDVGAMGNVATPLFKGEALFLF